MNNAKSPPAVDLADGMPLKDRPDLSPEELRKAATHVVVGQVRAVYQFQEYANRWVYKKFVTEVRVTESEKGEGLKSGDLVYARYWQRSWMGEGTMPPETRGQKMLPCVGETQRVYLARNANDGFVEVSDNGFDVMGPNGFEKIMGMKK